MRVTLWSKIALVAAITKDDQKLYDQTAGLEVPWRLGTKGGYGAPLEKCLLNEWMIQAKALNGGQKRWFSLHCNHENLCIARGSALRKLELNFGLPVQGRSGAEGPRVWSVHWKSIIPGKPAF